MGATTPKLNLYKPGGGSSGIIVPDERVDIDRINDNMDKIDAHAGEMIDFKATQVTRNQQFTGPAADMAGTTGMKLGDTYQETDANKRRWRYDGTVWVSDANGSFIVYPTTVSGTGATISANGEVVVVNGGSSVTVDGCVPNNCRELHIGIYFNSPGPSDSTILMRPRASGVDIANLYSIWSTSSIGTGPSRGESSAAADWSIGRSSAANGSFHSIEISHLNGTGRKFMHFHSVDAAMYSYYGSGVTGSNSAAMTGFRLGLPAGTSSNLTIKITAII